MVGLGVRSALERWGKGGGCSPVFSWFSHPRREAQSSAASVSPDGAPAAAHCVRAPAAARPELEQAARRPWPCRAGPMPSASAACRRAPRLAVVMARRGCELTPRPSCAAGERGFRSAPVSWRPEGLEVGLDGRARGWVPTPGLSWGRLLAVDGSRLVGRSYSAVTGHQVGLRAGVVGVEKRTGARSGKLAYDGRSSAHVLERWRLASQLPLPPSYLGTWTLGIP